MILYISGPYSGDIDQNIQNARKVAVDLWNKGYGVLCPHLNTQHFEMDCLATYEDYLTQDCAMLARCDALVMLPGWEDSKGAVVEYEFALRFGIPIYNYPELPEINSVETDCPVQTEEFMGIIMKLYRTYLSKNSDYSPNNVLATGQIGLVTRLWDKIARLMNLSGFKFKVKDIKFEAPKNPKNESIDDTFMDSACYSIIGLLLRKNCWGR